MPTIRINGDVRRSFAFPGNIDTALAFYGDIRRLVGWLKHVALVRAYDSSRLRMLYHTTELGLYGVSLYCDIEILIHPGEKLIRVVPLDGQVRVPPQATIQSLTAQGVFRSESIFHDQGATTIIDYHLHLSAEMPTPLAAQMLIPKPVLEKVAQSITLHRIDEIADAFIRQSLAAYGRGKPRLTSGR